MLIVDFTGTTVDASHQRAYYFQPESFERGTLVATGEPAMPNARRVTWKLGNGY